MDSSSTDCQRERERKERKKERMAEEERVRQHMSNVMPIELKGRTKRTRRTKRIKEDKKEG